MASITRLSVTPQAVNFGEQVTLAATVQPANPAAGIPAGSVAFLDGSAILQTVPLDGTGHATFSTTALAAGFHSLLSVYTPAITFSPSSSSPVPVTVATQTIGGGNNGSGSQGAIDVTALLNVSVTRPKGRKGLARRIVTLTNNGNAAVAGPLALVLDGLSRKIKLRRRTGFTSANPPAESQYLDVSPGGDGTLAPGATLNVILSFNNPLRKKIHFTLRILAGPGTR